MKTSNPPDMTTPTAPESWPVAVIIVTHQSEADIGRCLRSVLAARPAEVVVVDNGSTDGTAELVARFGEPVALVTRDKNVGFAAGCNIGLCHTRAPLVLLLNADAQLSEDYLARLVPVLTPRRHMASVVGKLVYEQDGKQYIDSAGIMLNRWRLSPEDRGCGEPDQGQYDQPEEIFGPSAAAALYRRQALQTLGSAAFDEQFFAYYEDVDLAWRLRRRGWRHFYWPKAVARHQRKGPHPKPTPVAARAFANRYLVFAKNEAWWRWAGYAPVATLWEVARIGHRALREPRLLSQLGPGLWRAGRAIRRRLSRDPVTTLSASK